nr:putative phosphatase [uncultured marine group II/III euryarchaeote AD1000_30_D02]
MRNKSVQSILSIALLFTILLTPLANTESSEGTTPELMTRIMMLPPDAEATGMHINANGYFFVNAMHPDNDNYRATIGVINGVDWNNLPSSVPELPSSSSASDTWNGIRTSYGDYQVLLQSGDVFSQGGVAGGIYAADNGNRMFTSEKPDYNAFVPLNADASRGYLYTAWEDRPAGISQLEIEWNSTSTEWEVLGGMMLDLSSVNGGWVLCFGSMSPWDTPLLSEELYFSDTEDWNDENYNYHSDQASLADYLGYYPNPYDYGYIMEIENSTTTEPDFIKHFAMGRFSHENAQVMPDERTVYLSDDGYDTVLFKFIADTAGDLSSGTLYAAKVTQDDSSDSATTGFDVEWIEMASSSNSDIQLWIDEYDGITTEDYIAGQNSYISDENIRDWAEWRLNDDLNGDGTIGSAIDDRVAFLESRKAAAALGASDEWNKMEGVAFNPNAPDYAYLAMSDVGYDMSDGQGDIDVTQNRCGIVYSMTLDAEWDVNRIDPLVSGGPYTSSATYECDVNNLAGPDNLVVLDDGRLLIGEDTGKHESNMVWLWGEIPESETEPEPDSDADGVVDPQDNCTDTPLGETVNAEGCSETQLSETVEGEDEPEGENETEDSDGDGYPDVTDLCDNTPNDSDERVYNVEANGCANMYAPYPEDCVNWEFWNSDLVNTEEFGRGCPHFNQQSTQDYRDARDAADTPQKWIIVPGLLVTSIIVLFLVRRMRQSELDEGSGN